MISLLLLQVFGIFQLTVTTGAPFPSAVISMLLNPAPAPFPSTPKLLNTASFADHLPAKLACALGDLRQYACSLWVKFLLMNVSLSILILSTLSTSTPILLFAVAVARARDSTISFVCSVVDTLMGCAGAVEGYVSSEDFLSRETRDVGSRKTWDWSVSGYGECVLATNKVLVMRPLWK